MKTDLRPLMRKSEIKILENELFSLAKQKGEISILEWGSGGSTIYFSNFLQGKGISFNWLSLEYNKNWYHQVLDRAKKEPNIEILLFDVGNNNLNQKHTNMDEYVNYPTNLNKKFDFILVDGRKRRRCLLDAQKLLNPNGVVFLHDAQRKYYHSAFKSYPDSAFKGPYLWRGKNETISSFRKTLNKLVYLFWQPIIWIRFWSITVLRKIYHQFLNLRKYKNESI